MTTKEPILSKNFMLLFLFSVTICTGMNMLNVIVPLYVTDTLHGTAATAGLMTAVYTVAACTSRPVHGILTDRLGRRRIMILGSLLFCGSCLIGGLVPALAALALCRIGMGIGYSAATTANNTASTDVIPSSRLAEGIGYFGMSQSVASAFGPALASAVIAFAGNQTALLAVAAAGGLALLFSLPVRYEYSSAYSKPAAAKRPSGGFWERTAVLPALFQGLSLFLISCLMCFMPLYIVSRGMPSGMAGSFFAVASVVIVSVRLICSRWMNRVQTACFLVPGYLCLIGVCVLLPRVDTVPGFLLAGVVYGAAHGTIWMTLGSEAVRLAPPERRGAANATFYFAFDAAIGLGSAFWGILIDWVGYSRCFTSIIAAAGILAAVSIPVFHRRWGAQSSSGT